MTRDHFGIAVKLVATVVAVGVAYLLQHVGLDVPLAVVGGLLVGWGLDYLATGYLPLRQTVD